MDPKRKLNTSFRRRPGRTLSGLSLFATLAALAYEVILLTPLLSSYRFPIPFAVPIFDTPFALVAIGGAYFCLERHRLRQDFRSASLGMALWLAGLLAIAHILAQPDYPGSPGVNPGVAPYFFFLSYLSPLVGIGLAAHVGARPWPLSDRGRLWIAAGILGLSLLIVAAVLQVRPLLPSLVMRPGRLTPFAIWVAGVSIGGVGVWALLGGRKSLLQKEQDWFAAPLLFGGFIWLAGLTGFLIFPYRYAISWYVAGLARPVGVAVLFVGLLREQVWLYRETRARQRDLESLYAAGQTLLTSLDVHRVADTITTTAVEISKADGAILFQLDPLAGALRPLSGAGLGSHESLRGFELPVGSVISGPAVVEQRPVWTSNLQVDDRILLSPEARARAREAGLKACWAVPLPIENGEVGGALAVCWKEEREFADTELRLLAAYGTQAAIALEKAWAFGQLALKAKTDAALHEFSQRLLEAPSKEAILEEAVRAARDVLQADCVDVLLHDRAATCLRLEAGLGWESGTVDVVTVSPSAEALAGYCLTSNETVQVEELSTERRFATSPYLAQHGIRSVIVAPLGALGQPEGVLGVYYRTPHRVNAAERRNLISLGNQTGLALEKVRLYLELQDNLRRLQETQAQLLQADKLNALGTLLSGMAHELNNPLTSILLSAQIVKQHAALPDLVRRRMDTVEQAAERAAKIIRDLLTFARRQPPERQRVDFNGVIKATLALQAPTFDLDQIRVVTELAPDVPEIWADANQLQQVLLNLFTNAGHAMKSARGRGTLTVRSFLDGSEVCAQADDDGPGIPPEQLSRVFDPFFTTKPAGTGTGLGLSLCIGIIENHGGRMEVENLPHAGARFTLRLPIRKMAEPVESPAVETPKAEARQARILLVDDEKQLLEIVGEILTAEGHQVKSAGTGREAIASLEQETFDIVMLDLRMPEIDGKEVWRWILSRDPALTSRVVFMTGDLMSAESDRFLLETGRPVLSKPLNMEAVYQVISDVLGTTAPAPA